MLEVQLSGTLRDAANGAASINIEAATIRELLRKVVEQYPRMAEKLEAGIAVSIDGNIFRDNWGEAIPAQAEIFLLPRIPGG
jgi:molybdopterin converting factor small subunit